MLENTPLLGHFRTKDITIEAYITILKKFYTFFSQLEKQLEHTGIEHVLVDYIDRRKAALLIGDLKFLGQKIQMTNANVVPKISSLSESFGALYVMEGSTLGGKFISAVLQEKLNIGPESGGSFFYGYGMDTSTKWKIFCESLTTYNQKFQEDDQIISTACATFLQFRTWLENINSQDTDLSFK
ncbi:MAG: biliverdin-producing heme oxygenase [Opitutaceae bacterium]|nr:biliverdin-producing heme oxygenase [Cytophagales bacterium]